MGNFDLIVCRRTVGGLSRAFRLGARAVSFCAIAGLLVLGRPVLADPDPMLAAAPDATPGTPGSATYRLGISSSRLCIRRHGFTAPGDR